MPRFVPARLNKRRERFIRDTHSIDYRITLDAFLRTPTGGRFYDALALLAVTAALRGVEERPFDAGVTAGMGRVVREIDGMRGEEE
jgi:hypothetical protein